MIASKKNEMAYKVRTKKYISLIRKYMNPESLHQL